MSLQRLTFDQLPEAVFTLARKVDYLTSLLEAKEAEINQSSARDDKPLNVQQAATFLGISPQTVYQRVKDLPHKKRFGRLYFYESDLRAYLNAGEVVAND